MASLPRPRSLPTGRASGSAVGCGQGHSRLEPASHSEAEPAAGGAERCRGLRGGPQARFPGGARQDPPLRSGVGSSSFSSLRGRDGDATLRLSWERGGFRQGPSHTLGTLGVTPAQAGRGGGQRQCLCLPWAPEANLGSLSAEGGPGGLPGGGRVPQSPPYICPLGSTRRSDFSHQPLDPWSPRLGRGTWAQEGPASPADSL